MYSTILLGNTGTAGYNCLGYSSVAWCMVLLRLLIWVWIREQRKITSKALLSLW